MWKDWTMCRSGKNVCALSVHTTDSRSLSFRSKSPFTLRYPDARPGLPGAGISICMQVAGLDAFGSGRVGVVRMRRRAVVAMGIAGMPRMMRSCTNAEDIDGCENRLLENGIV